MKLSKKQNIGSTSSETGNKAQEIRALKQEAQKL
jgi:hypothetical protein